VIFEFLEILNMAGKKCGLKNGAGQDRREGARQSRNIF
jgi:hypothetical protein